MKQTTAIVQARMNSSRLPGKVMRSILGQPMLKLQLNRIRQANNLDLLVVATTTQTQDESIARLARKLNILVFRGSQDNVLDRYYQAVQTYQAGTIIRLTADCPLIDPQIIDQAITIFRSKKYDFVTNTLVDTFPRGMDVEVFSSQTLQSIWRQATSPYDREHVTTYVLSHPDKFHIYNLKATAELKRPNLRLTVDEEPDFVLVKNIYKALYRSDPSFSLRDIIKFLDKHPQLKQLNQDIRQKPILYRTSPK